ncbi:MAG TPA: SRPBCC domain-containing protein [Erysipelotrichaceae bacterium]|nr:SRPBCC domain-containing protein [Erysipelotrichaceae bacterium]
MTKRINITIETNIKAPIEKVWDTWNNPKHVVNWNHASDDWFSPRATNDFNVGGKFVYRMEARDGSFGFDFSGSYIDIQENKLVVTRLDDDRLVSTEFIPENDSIKVVETFEAEGENSVELQREGWLAILTNFKNYTESI